MTLIHRQNRDGICIVQGGRIFMTSCEPKWIILKINDIVFFAGFTKKWLTFLVKIR